jgi:hypothetical protein
MNDRMLQIVAVRFNETNQYVEKYRTRNRIKAVYGVYLYDSSEATHCCEGPPSYCLYPVDNDFVFEDDVTAEERELLLDRIGSELAYVWVAWEQERYVHCQVIDKLPPDRKLACGEYETLRDAVEAYHANPKFG